MLDLLARVIKMSHISNYVAGTVVSLLALAKLLATSQVGNPCVLGSRQ